MNNEFEWKYCPTCDVMMVVCWKCNNNCCNGGFGEVNGIQCDVCEKAYEYQKTQTPPEKPEDWEERKEQQWQTFKKLFGTKQIK